MQWLRVALDQIEALPDDPGVYRFLDGGGRILYVGKSVHLRTRVRSYLRRDGGHSRQTERLKHEAATVEVLSTGSELAALLLEGRLIRSLQPPFNQAQKRFRHYPFLRLSLQEEYPRLHLTRVLADDGAEYYGPYSQPRFVEMVARLLSMSLGLRDCQDLSAIHQGCLLDQLGKCLGPCRSAAVAPEYRERVVQLRALLRGEGAEALLARFEEQMLLAAEREQFEQAARWRDRLSALRAFVLHQGYLREKIRLDAVTLQPGPPTLPRSLQLFWVRRGKVVAQQCLPDTCSLEAVRSAALDILREHYAVRAGEDTDALFAQQDLDEVQMVGGWLYRHRQDADLLWLAELSPERTAALLVELVAARRQELTYKT
jgi:excinuclease UvrABC nuclease subunit